MILLFTKSEREIKEMMKNLGKYMRERELSTCGMDVAK
jgi:hypothetical protein